MMSTTGSVTATTLCVAGLVWVCSKMNGRVAFRHAPHAILFNPCTGYYQIKECGETVFAAKSVSECLENAAEIVWDYHANRIVPSWEGN